MNVYVTLTFKDYEKSFETRIGYEEGPTLVFNLDENQVTQCMAGRHIEKAKITIVSDFKVEKNFHERGNYFVIGFTEHLIEDVYVFANDHKMFYWPHFELEAIITKERREKIADPTYTAGTYMDYFGQTMKPKSELINLFKESGVEIMENPSYTKRKYIEFTFPESPQDGKITREITYWNTKNCLCCYGCGELNRSSTDWFDYNEEAEKTMQQTTFSFHVKLRSLSGLVINRVVEKKE